MVDNSVYYYEEVVDDGGRELFFKVSMDRQNDFQSSNPLSTQLFCDNQRNPTIEDYNCDFSDLFNDIDTDVVETSPAKVPPSAENLDALEFLDEITSINTSHGQNESDIRFDSIIDEILNESPVTSSPNQMPPPAPPPPQMHHSHSTAQNVNSSKSKQQPKLLKCTQHLKKEKKAQNRKTPEKSKPSFTAAIQKTRKSRTKGQSDSASTDVEPDRQQIPEQKPNPNPSQTPKPSSTAGFLSTANNLRPIELARKLSTLKSINTNSEFLRRYMKAKEEKMFAAEIAQEKAIQTESEAKKAAVTNQNTMPSSSAQPMTASPEQPITNATQTNTTKKPLARKSVKKEPPVNVSAQSDGEVKKKERKPRTKKQIDVGNAAIDTEVASGVAATTTKKATTAKRKPVKENHSTEASQTNAETMGQNIEAAIKTEPKKNSRKRKATSVDADGTKSVEGSIDGNFGPAKRQRKPKCNEGDEIKPKRSRTTKPKVTQIKLEQPSAPLMLNDDGNGK